MNMKYWIMVSWKLSKKGIISLTNHDSSEVTVRSFHNFLRNPMVDGMDGPLKSHAKNSSLSRGAGFTIPIRQVHWDCHPRHKKWKHMKTSLKLPTNQPISIRLEMFKGPKMNRSFARSCVLSGVTLTEGWTHIIRQMLVYLPTKSNKHI